jgi:hypothetical protein
MLEVWSETLEMATVGLRSLADRDRVHYKREFMVGRTSRRAAFAGNRRSSRLGAGARVTVIVGVCAVLACHSRMPMRVLPVQAAASEALSDAQACLRKTDPESRQRGRELAQRAHELEPEWVAPERLLDELLRDDLRGIEALSEHRSRLARLDEHTPATVAAGELYLAGRLEGLDGKERFERAVRVDPDLAWGYHGLSWVASVGGDPRESVVQARLALERARDSWERTFFTSSLARALVAADAREEAEKLLQDRIADSDTRESDAIALEKQAVEIGLEAMTLRQRAKSYERGLMLLREQELSETEVESLVAKLRLSPSPDDPDALALQSSLAVRESPARDRLRAELMLESAPTPLALGLLQRGLEAEKRVVPAGSLMRAARFAAGEYARAIELWLAELPACVLTQAGLPADPRLSRVVERARALGHAPPSSTSGPTLGPTSGPTSNLRARDSGPGAVAAAASSGSPTAPSAALADLGEALLEIGWFREARSVAGELAAQDLDRALAIESRALAGQELIESVRRLVRKVDLERGASAPASSADVDTYRVVKDGEGALRFEVLGERTGIHDLSSLLTSMAPSFARAHVFLGGDSDPARVTRELVDSPRMSYGPIGELVHPGPRFSSEDQSGDLGRAGERVPGLASELEKIGRFGLFGEVAGGGGPDGTLLPRIYLENKQGVHLGVPWSGTVAWCESAELKSRAGRRGAHISAAALHEGYWVDVDAVRGERALWTALRREFGGPESRERIARLLAVRGLELEAGDPERRSRERTKTGFLLGEAQRVRLALLVERGAQPATSGAQPATSGVQSSSSAVRDASAKGSLALDRPLGDVSLDELLKVTSTHEEGHLCDRTRYLPIAKHVGPVFLFLLDCGFSPKKVAEMLEYRAQLTCLCDSPDPRVALAQVLDAAEQGPTGITPHASGYALLLSDLLDVFDVELARHPREYPTIDTNYTLAHQLHSLGAEDVRKLALRLAHKKRLPR